jgi:signal transduction histidine kinase
MRERVHFVGGSMEIASNQQGTRIIFSLPIAEAEPGRIQDGPLGS